MGGDFFKRLLKIAFSPKPKFSKGLFDPKND